jgi:hypothetical protein
VDDGTVAERTPRRNRVTPTGEIVAVDARGTFYGNRGGCMHDAEGRIVRTHASRAWLVCVLESKGRRRTPLMQPGRFTELFFLDEATALAAGHRPCYECRRADATAFAQALAAGAGLARPLQAADVDAALHPHRLPVGEHRPTWRAPCDALPDGTIVRHGRSEWLVAARSLHRWTFHGYGPAERRPGAAVEVLTPEPTVRAIAAGYPVALHPSVR